MSILRNLAKHILLILVFLSLTLKSLSCKTVQKYELFLEQQSCNSFKEGKFNSSLFWKGLDIDECAARCYIMNKESKQLPYDKRNIENSCTYFSYDKITGCSTCLPYYGFEKTITSKIYYSPQKIPHLCSRNYCKNGGKCVQRLFKKSCECKPFYNGKHCENIIIWQIILLVFLIIIPIVLCVIIFICCKKYRFYRKGYTLLDSKRQSGQFSNEDHFGTFDNGIKAGSSYVYASPKPFQKSQVSTEGHFDDKTQSGQFSKEGHFKTFVKSDQAVTKPFQKSQVSQEDDKRQSGQLSTENNGKQADKLGQSGSNIFYDQASPKRQVITEDDKRQSGQLSTEDQLESYDKKTSSGQPESNVIDIQNESSLKEQDNSDNGIQAENKNPSDDRTQSESSATEHHEELLVVEKFFDIEQLNNPEFLKELTQKPLTSLDELRDNHGELIYEVTSNNTTIVDMMAKLLDLKQCVEKEYQIGTITKIGNLSTYKVSIKPKIKYIPLYLNFGKRFSTITTQFCFEPLTDYEQALTLANESKNKNCILAYKVTQSNSRDSSKTPSLTFFNSVYFFETRFAPSNNQEKQKELMRITRKENKLKSGNVLEIEFKSIPQKDKARNIIFYQKIQSIGFVCIGECRTFKKYPNEIIIETSFEQEQKSKTEFSDLVRGRSLCFSFKIINETKNIEIPIIKKELEKNLPKNSDISIDKNQSTNFEGIITISQLYEFPKYFLLKTKGKEYKTVLSLIKDYTFEPTTLKKDFQNTLKYNTNITEASNIKFEILLCNSQGEALNFNCVLKISKGNYCLEAKHKNNEIPIRDLEPEVFFKLKQENGRNTMYLGKCSTFLEYGTIFYY